MSNIAHISASKQRIDLPFKEIRQRIMNVQIEPVQMALLDLYLKAGRSCEAIAYKCPSDTTTPYGPIGNDATIEYIGGREAVILSVHTAKRDGIERIVALPTDHEPLCKVLYDYYQSKGDNYVFPFTRQWLSKKAKEAKVFEGYIYPISMYKISNEGEIIEVPAHERPASLHWLRHLRATELVRKHHFKAEDLAAYCGWRLGTVTKATSVMERYIDLGSYIEYFPKL